MEIRKLPDLRELRKLRKLGYLDVRPSQYIEYAPDALDKKLNGERDGYLCYVDIIDNLRITPIVWGNRVCYVPATPDDFKNNHKYMLSVHENNEVPSTFLKGHYYRRITINDRSQLQLNNAIAVTSYGSIPEETLKFVAELYGGLPVITYGGDVMDFFDKVNGVKR